MYEKILVPLDGSEVGEAALPSVEELVVKLVPKKVEVTLVAVITHLTHFVIAGETTAQVPYTEKEIDQIKNKIMAYQQKVAERLRSKGATVNHRIETGNAAEQILKVSREIGADLIAMSTHGRSGLSRWALGSVTDKVVREANVPILTVRAPKETSKT